MKIFLDYAKGTGIENYFLRGEIKYFILWLTKLTLTGYV
jgi:hypothetical protein